MTCLWGYEAAALASHGNENHAYCSRIHAAHQTVANCPDWQTRSVSQGTWVPAWCDLLPGTLQTNGHWLGTGREKMLLLLLLQRTVCERKVERGRVEKRCDDSVWGGQEQADGVKRWMRWWQWVLEVTGMEGGENKRNIEGRRCRVWDLYFTKMWFLYVVTTGTSHVNVNEYTGFPS